MAFITIGLAVYARIYFQPVAIVVPHHNLVQTTRQQFLKEISRRRLFTRHIVLISPDHFSPRQTFVSSSTREWDLSSGVAKYNNFLNIDLPSNDAIQNDHGIFNPLADLRTYFPSADYLPIIIGQKTSVTDLQTLLTQLKKHCSFDCLLVSSVDFSHYLPATMAFVHDSYTLNNLQNLDTEKLLISEVDSPQSLYLLSSFAQHRHALRWSTFAHTNSGFIASDPDSETTTHFFGAYSRGKKITGNTYTFMHLPYKIDRTLSQTTVGDRFFYGVDKTIQDSYVPNFTIAKIISPNKVIKSFLPMDGNSFIRGPLKQQLIKQYFDSISTTGVTKDYFWGTLIYE